MGEGRGGDRRGEGRGGEGRGGEGRGGEGVVEGRGGNWSWRGIDRECPSSDCTVACDSPTG